ncbi:MAG: cache domain-containing protein [Desulfuromonas sp.]|nr:cache domain-containing protein [Desulfuromonas sp.]
MIKKIAKITIKNAIMLTFVPLLALALVLILYVNKSTSEQGLYSIAKQTMAKNINWTERYVASLAVPAQEIGGYIATQLLENGNARSDKYLIDMMLERIRYADHINSIYIGKPDGAFLLVGWRPRYYQRSAPQWLYSKQISVIKGQRYASEQWINPDNRQIRQSHQLLDDTYDPRQRPWFQKALAMQHECWTSPYIFSMTNKAGITYAAPINDSNNAIAAVVGVDLKVDTISAFLSNNRFSTNSVNFLLTAQGDIISHPDLVANLAENDIPTIQDVHDPILVAGMREYLSSAAFHRGENFFSIIDSPAGPRDIIFKAIKIGCSDSFIVGEHVPESDYLAIMKKSNQQALFISGIVLVCFIAVGGYLARTLARPIQNLSNFALRIKNLDFDATINNNSKIVEINTTMESFNNMVDSLQENCLANEKLTAQLQKSYLDTLYRLALAAEYKDQETAGHLDRVSGYSTVIAEELGLSTEEIDILRQASIMHDVGKLAIPDSVLLKEGKLNSAEWEIIRQHPQFGGNILHDPSSTMMETARIVAISHHEKWDGSGYPNGLAGEDIPLIGRIVAVADVFDALMSKRSYKEAFSFKDSVAIINNNSNNHFDPRCVQAFNKRLAEIERIAQQNCVNSIIRGIN